MNYLSEVKGKSGTVARVVAYSIAENSKTALITFEYEAYRGILAELNTHSILCKNAESSRAVPVKNRIKQIRDNPYVPVYWGSNKPGMVAGEEINNPVVFNNDSQEYEGNTGCPQYSRDEAWRRSAEVVATIMEDWDNAGYHKQIVNRLGEAFTTVKGVISGTEWDNFWHLRRAPDADPAIKELADCMWLAKEAVEREMTYEFLKPGEWHTPYVQHTRRLKDNKLIYGFTELDLASGENYFDEISLEEALKTSSVACGQVSFRKLDTSGETVERVWQRLMGGEAVHASVTQHQGTPMELFEYDFKQRMVNAIDCFNHGVSHIDRTGHFWSAQFKHWVMFRKTLPNEVCHKYIPEEENV